MCLAAIYWARISKAYYAGTQNDAARCGFDDRKIYRVISRLNRKSNLKMTPLLRREALAVFEQWNDKPDKVIY